MPTRSQALVGSRWEWLAAALSALIVLALVGILLYGGATRSTPPDIAVRADSASRGTGLYLLHFTVRNAGTQSAASLHVDGELWQGGRLLERSQATLDYVPGHAVRHGGLFFTRDPRSHSLRIRPSGYEQP